MSITSITTYRTIYNSVYRAGNPDPKRGFGGWQHVAQVVRGAVLEAKAQLDQDIAELRKVYTEPEVKRRLPAFQEEYDNIVKLAREKLEKALDATVKEKVDRYHQIALTPPTAPQLRLLQTLSLRDDLSAAEIAAVGADLGENLQAQRALGSIARRAGFSFPTYGSIERFTDDLERAEEYSRDMLHSLDKPEAELGYMERCFWMYEGIGYPAALYGPVDTPIYSAVQQATAGADAGEPGHGKAQPVDKQKKPITITLTGAETIGQLADKYDTTSEAIKAENPDVHDGRDMWYGRTMTITPGEGYHAGVSD